MSEPPDPARPASDALAEAGRMLVQTLDAGELRALVAAGVRALLGASFAAVMVVDSESGELATVASATDAEPDLVPPPIFSQRRRLATRAVCERRAIVAATPPGEHRDTAHGSALAVPLVARERLIGALVAVDATERSFGPDEIRLAEAFAEGAALALDNARRYAEADERRREAEILADLGRSINASLDVDTVLQRIVDGAKDLCASDLARIALRDGRTGAMIFRYWTDRPAPAEPAAAGLGTLTGKHYLHAARTEGVIADMVVPIVIDGRTEGLLYVNHRSPRVFTALHEAILQRLADQVAIAIRNARLFEETERRRKTAESLIAVGRLISQSLDPDLVGQRIADSVRRLLDAKTSVLYRVEPESGTLVPRAIAGGHRRDAGSLSALPPTGVAALAARERTPVVSIDEARDPRVAAREPPAGLPAGSHRAALAVPLQIRERVIGALVIRDAIGRAFVDEDVHVAQAFADQAALAWEHARMFAAIQTQATALLAQRDRLRLLSAENATAKENEARRIATVLQEEAAQLIAAVHLALHEMVADTPAARAQHVVRIGELLDQIEEQLRWLSHELRPTILDNLGLRPALEFLGQGVSARTKLAVGVEGTTQGRLPPMVETALFRIAQEALTNAARHASARQVTIRLERDAETVRCSIRDDGIGFDPAAVTRRKEGTGLGLLGIRERLHAVNGTLDLRTAPGQGTELRVAVPLSAFALASVPLAGPDAPFPELAERPGDSALPELGGVRVLVVDDEPEALELLTIMLEQCGAVVIGAASADEARRVFERQPPDVLVSDIMMPVTDGYELIRRVRALPPAQGGQVPAVALTARTSVEDRARALAAGFQVHVAKPIDPLDVCLTVATLIGAPAGR